MANSQKYEAIKLSKNGPTNPGQKNEAGEGFQVNRFGVYEHWLKELGWFSLKNKR